MSARVCEHPECTTRIKRKRRVGPWPKRCAAHTVERQRELRRTVYRRPRKYSAPVVCCDCPAEIAIPEHGKPPARCPECSATRKRTRAAERQRKFRNKGVDP